MTQTSVPRLLILGAAALATAACTKTPDASTAKTPLASGPSMMGAGEPQAGGPNAVPVAARAALDSGNMAFKAKRYDIALAMYREAASKAPGHPAPLYGIYMAADKQGNKALADSAMAQVQANAKDSQLGDSAIAKMHEQAGQLPMGHPQLTPTPAPRAKAAPRSAT
jgi:hypothetical protein